MTKPILEVTLLSMGGSSAKVRAVFDSGSRFTIVREERLPARTHVSRYPEPEELKTAAEGGRLQVSGRTVVNIEIGEKLVSDEVLVSPNLAQEMLLGAGTMQKWDISIRNSGGRNRVTVGHDLREPDSTEVD